MKRHQELELQRRLLAGFQSLSGHKSQNMTDVNFQIAHEKVKTAQQTAVMRFFLFVSCQKLLQLLPSFLTINQMKQPEKEK